MDLPTGDFSPHKSLPQNHIELETITNKELAPDNDVLKMIVKQGEGRARFWNMLVDTVSMSGFEPPQDRPTQILHIACGRAQEADILTAYFGGGQFGANSNGAALVGIDIDPNAIKNAIDFSSLPQPGGPIAYKLPDNMIFICGNATELDKIQGVPDKIDVVIVRNEKISDNVEVWKKIFSQSAAKLLSSGIMLITSYSDSDHKMSENAIQELGLKIMVNQENKWAEELQPGTISDKRVLIAKPA